MTHDGQPGPAILEARGLTVRYADTLPRRGRPERVIDEHGSEGEEEPPVLRPTGADVSGPIYADAVIPRSLVGALPDNTRHTLFVSADPGRDLPDRLTALGLSVDSYPAYEEYDFVATMRAIIWTIAAVVLGIGLLALAIATLDRAVQRRKEVVALQLVGVDPRLLRRAQLLESAVPLTVGIVLSVGLGALAGAGVLGGLVIAALCTVAAAPRLRPEEIRAE